MFSNQKRRRDFMDISVYDITVPEFQFMLNNLKNILVKTKAYAETKKIDMPVFFNTRLTVDQFPLGKQIQMTCDTAKFFVGRLANIDVPVFEDNEQTFDQYTQRIDKTVNFIKSVKPEQFKGFETRKYTSIHKPGKSMDGKSYLVQHVIPNFYFHMTTAYSILRANGVDIGKKDYLGPINWVDDK